MKQASESILSEITVTCVKNNGQDASFFAEENITLTGTEARQLSEQIGAINFRLRQSPCEYASDWHVAGDRTLLIILSGSVRITLRDGNYKDFAPGEMFIADDYLAEGIAFSDIAHGHCAEAIGVEPLKALHLKLSRRK